jgi:hypothetical protein
LGTRSVFYGTHRLYFLFLIFKDNLQRRTRGDPYIQIENTLLLTYKLSVSGQTGKSLAGSGHENNFREVRKNHTCLFEKL